MPMSDFLVRDVRLPGHFWADNEVYDIFAPKLGAYGFAVYMALCRKAKNYTGECELSMRMLARDLDVSVSTIHQSLERIIDLGLAIRTREGGPRVTGMYLLADVKTLVDPVLAAQLRLNAPPTSVRIANAQSGGVRTANTVVRQANAASHQANAASATRTRNKEEKTLKTSKTEKTCDYCANTGLRTHRGHPGRQFYCDCALGQQMHKQDQQLEPAGNA